MMTEPSYNQLLIAAKDALKKAYAPYSNRANGAALLTKDGRIFTGCTIEISNFSSSICATKAALIKAITEGARHFTAMAITGDGVDSNYLCGDCRQSLAEFGLNTVIISEMHPDKLLILHELLPNASFPYKN